MTTERIPPTCTLHLGYCWSQVEGIKKESENHAVISVDEMPLLYAELDAMQSVSARALQFAFLTASRSKAVRSANWDEFDLDNALWIILVEHDKMKQRKRGRTIVLSRQAVELIKGLPRYSGQQRVFLSNQMNTLSDMTLSMHLRRMHRRKKTDDNLGWIDREKTARTGKESVVTPHGCARATFRTWEKDDVLGNNRKLDQEAVELCLLHSKNDPYEGAYNRARLLGERRRIMQEWADYCCSALEKI